MTSLFELEAKIAVQDLGQGLSLQTHTGTTMMLFSVTEYRKLDKLNANSNLILNFARKQKWRMQGPKRCCSNLESSAAALVYWEPHHRKGLGVHHSTYIYWDFQSHKTSRLI